MAFIRLTDERSGEPAFISPEARLLTVNRCDGGTAVSFSFEHENHTRTISVRESPEEVVERWANPSGPGASPSLPVEASAE